MIDPRDLPGEWFSVRETIKNQTIVTPEAVKQGPAPIAGGKFINREGLTICGFAYSYVSAAGGGGFDIVADDDTFNPGSTTSHVVWRTRAPAAANQLVEFCVPQTLLPVAPSEVNTTTPCNGASLRIVVTGDAVGWVAVWGFHGPATLGFTDKAFSGSPHTFS